MEDSERPTPYCDSQLSGSHYSPKDNGVSEELQAHLINLYFDWEQPWLQVVNEKFFRDSLANGGRYCSPLLLNSILAIGSRYCDRVEVRANPDDPNSAGRIFIDKAENLIQNDLRWPKITTIQSLAIMGMVYIVRFLGSPSGMYRHKLTFEIILGHGIRCCWLASSGYGNSSCH